MTRRKLLSSCHGEFSQPNSVCISFDVRSDLPSSRDCRVMGATGTGTFSMTPILIEYEHASIFVYQESQRRVLSKFTQYKPILIAYSSSSSLPTTRRLVIVKSPRHSTSKRPTTSIRVLVAPSCLLTPPALTTPGRMLLIATFSRRSYSSSNQRMGKCAYFILPFRSC